ncbi:hypothetical protein ACF0H5_019746 [Mactra antiquata]
MSLITRRRKGQNVHEASLKQYLNESIKILDSNKIAIEKLRLDVIDVEVILAEESDQIAKEVEKRADTIKQVLDEYVENIKSSLKVRTDRNTKCIADLNNRLDHELESCLQDRTKCETCLKDVENNDDDIVVNKAKVLELTLGSISAKKFTLPKSELVRPYIANSTNVKTDDLLSDISNMIGEVNDRTETIQEIKYPTNHVAVFDVPDAEVNAIAVGSSGGKTTPKVWVNQGVSTELLQYSSNGKHLNKIHTDFKVNDITMDANGKLLATSTDCYRLRCLQPMSHGKHMQIYSITDKLYLHSVALSYDGKTIVACGTDAPNYTDQCPNEVVIVEYTPPGKELKRIAISDYIGKVYRIVQTCSNNYVLTFPKDGKVLSVNGLNGEVNAIFDSSDFYRYLPKRTNTVGDASFWPSGICCNSREQIFVTEYVHRLLLMLDKDCHFIRFIGLDHSCPNAVCYNETDNTLWLGDKGKIKVWKIKNTCTNKT